MKHLLIGLSLLFPIAFNAQTVVFEENFDSGELPEDWVIIDNDGYTPHPSVEDFADAWVVVQDPDNADNFVAGSTSYFQPVDRANRWLITPPIQLDAFGNFVSWHAKSHDPSYPDSYRVMVSNGGTEISDFTDTLAIISNENPDGTTRDFQIEGKDNQTVRIAFVNTTFNGFKLYLDSIQVRTEDPLSVEKNTSNQLTLKAYPNPTSGKITLSKTVDRYQLFSISGELIATESHPTDRLNITDLPKGMYIIHAAINGELTHLKIVKE